MIDNAKFLTTDVPIINRLLLHPDFVRCKPKNNYYHSLMHKDFGIKMSLDFRKAVESGRVVGFGHLEINISPHYHFNNYKHNGNDFSPENSIKSITGILNYLGIKPTEYEALKVCNVEFGINVIPETDVKKIVDGLLLYKRTPFKFDGFPYYKKTDATSYKQIKAYAKGLHCQEVLKVPEIDINTFRFEVKSKQAKSIKTFGIYSAKDLQNINAYSRLIQVLADEWDNILIVNSEPNLEGLTPAEVGCLESGKSVDFWTGMYRVKFARFKEKYHSILGAKNNLHLQIKTKIIDKLFSFQNVTNSTQGNPINRGNLGKLKKASPLINLENVTF